MIRRLGIATLAGCLAGVVAVLVPSVAAAQRGELALLVGGVRAPDEEFDRVIGSSAIGPSFYTRQRGRREPGVAFGAAATFAIRGHVFAEIGVLHHGVERAIAATGLGDETGPFITTNRFNGSITSFWMGPSYRFVDRERTTLAGVIAPTVLLMSGVAYDTQQVFYNAPTRGTTMGVLVGLRGRRWITERVGAQVSIDDVIWTFPLSPHPADGSSFAPQASKRAPPQHDIRVQLGLTLRLY